MPETLMDRLQRQIQDEFPVPLVDDTCPCPVCKSDLAKILPCERKDEK